MVQVIEMSHQEKVEMYRMVDKENLIEMLIEANNVIRRLTPVVTEAALSAHNYCKCHQSQVYNMNGTNICCTCNKPLSA